MGCFLSQAMVRRCLWAFYLWVLGMISTICPGCREIARHEENGLLVPARDSKTLAQALRRLVDDPGLRRRFGARGREIAEAEFSVQAVVEKTLALYDRLLAAAGRPA